VKIFAQQVMIFIGSLQVKLKFQNAFIIVKRNSKLQSYNSRHIGIWYWPKYNFFWSSQAITHCKLKELQDCLGNTWKVQKLKEFF